MMTFEQVKCETPDLAKQNLEKLKALFPGVVTEGPDGVAIDVEALKQECSATPIEGNVERYEFTWPGKRAAKAAASITNDFLNTVFILYLFYVKQIIFQRNFFHL
mgnify:CR=1 FL=1